MCSLPIVTVVVLVCGPWPSARGGEDPLRPINLTAKQREYVMKEVVQRLGNPDFDRRHQGLLNAVRLGPTSVPLLIELLAKESDPVPRRMALLSLGAIGDPAGRQKVRQVLRDPGASQDELVAACFAAGMLGAGDADLHRDLCRRLIEGQPLARRSAAVALARLQDHEAVPDLLPFAVKEPLDLVRATFDLALGLIGDGNSYRHLCDDAVRAGNPLVRRASLLGLANLPRGELGKEDPLVRPEAELRKRDELAELALLGAQSSRTAPLTLVLAKAAEARRDPRELEDALFAVAQAHPDGAAAYFLEVIERWRASPMLPAVLLAAAALPDAASTGEVAAQRPSALRAQIVGALDHGDAAVRRAAVLALSVAQSSLDDVAERLTMTPDPDVEVRRTVLQVLAFRGLADRAAAEDRIGKWPADRVRPIADALDACRATWNGALDARVAHDAVEAQLRELKGRFGYRLAARRDQVLLSSLELDRLLRRDDGRSGGAVPDGSGSRTGSTDGGQSTGGGQPPGGGQGSGGGQSSGGSDSGDPQGGQPDSKLGGRRRSTVQNERIEHDLRLFLADYEYFPRFWPGALGP